MRISYVYRAMSPTHLLLLWVLDGLAKTGKGISHLSSGNVCACVLESLFECLLAPSHSILVLNILVECKVTWMVEE